MLGVVSALLTSASMSIITWRIGLVRVAERECSALQQCLDAGWSSVCRGIGCSRPEGVIEHTRSERRGHREETRGCSRLERVIQEIAAVRERPAEVVNVLNETLHDIDHETRGAQRVSRGCSRVSLTAGMAGACIEIALGLQVSTLTATSLALIAVGAGVAGGASCAGIGQWATRKALLRRRLWDEFVQRILNSEFRETAWTERAPGLRPTNDVENGQDT